MCGLFYSPLTSCSQDKSCPECVFLAVVITHAQHRHYGSSGFITHQASFQWVRRRTQWCKPRWEPIHTASGAGTRSRCTWEVRRLRPRRGARATPCCWPHVRKTNTRRNPDCRWFQTSSEVLECQLYSHYCAHVLRVARQMFQWGAQRCGAMITRFSHTHGPRQSDDEPCVHLQRDRERCEDLVWLLFIFHPTYSPNHNMVNPNLNQTSAHTLPLNPSLLHKI